MSTERDDGDDRRGRALRQTHEATSFSENDLVATATVSIRFEITTGIDEQARAALQNSPRIVLRRPHRTELLQYATERNELAHREIVRERIDGCIGAERAPQREPSRRNTIAAPRRLPR